MKRVLSFVAVLAVLVFATGARADADSATHYYLALGDSLAASVQPNGDFSHGYAEQLYGSLLGRDPKLELVKLGCGGESTTTMIVRSPWCGFTAGSQLAEAEAFLRAHRGEVAFVTIDIGGNDLIAADGGGVAAVQVNLPVILAQLRAAAGPDVPIVGMNYYYPFLPDIWFGTHDPSALQGAVDAITQFNDVLASLYADAADPVADVETAYSTTDTGDADADGVPTDVENVCAWTWQCASPPHGPDLHPNTAGYGVIARAFDDALA